MLFWNYPPGKKNLSASYLNLPESLVKTLDALKTVHYQTEVPDSGALTQQFQQLLALYYRSGRLQPLIDAGLGETFPFAVYQRWLQMLPPDIVAGIEARWGKAEQGPMIVYTPPGKAFVISRLSMKRNDGPDPKKGNRS